MRRASLRARLLLLVALAVLPAFAVIVGTALEQRRAAVREAQEAALRLAVNVADTQRDAIEAARHLLDALAHLPVVRVRDAAACSRTFAEIIKEFPRYASLSAVAPDGEVFCSGIPLPRPVNLADRPLFRRALQTRRFVVGTVKRGMLTGKPLVILVVPALDDAGRVVAAVSVGLELGWLADRVREAAPPPLTHLLVVDEASSVILEVPEPHAATGQPPSDVEPVRTALASGHGVTRGVGADGLARLFGFTSIGEPGHRLFVIASMSEALALAPSARALWRNLAVLGAVAVCAFAIAWFGAELIVLRPVRELVAATRRLAGGDLTARAAPSKIDEIGDLAHAFNDMGDTLASTQAALSTRLKATDALLGVARVVGGVTDLGEALRLISREVARLTGADTVSAFLVADDRSVLRPVAAYHLPKDALDEMARAQLSLSDLRFPPALFEGGHVVWTDDVQSDPRFENLIFRKFGHQSGAMVPLVLDGQTWGGFYLIWWTQARRFGDDELALLQGISQEAGLLIRTTRLYHEAEARRRIAEAAKERYRLLFDRNLAGVFRGTRDGRMIECNEAFARINGLASRDDVLGRSARDFYADPAERDALLQRLDEDRRVVNHEIRARRANGDEFPALVSIAKVNDGTGEYLEGIVIDISDRKHAEEAGRRIETLRSVAALANAAAHEINNPLAVMVAHVDIAALRTQDPETQERLAKVRAAAQRIRDIVARMYRVTRVELAADPPGLPDRLDLDRSSDLP